LGALCLPEGAPHLAWTCFCADMTLCAGNSTENHVPHYDMHGHQHHREPFKDKTYTLHKEIRHPKWLEPAQGVRSRSELIQARQKARVPDYTYDFDGDGAVGSLDHFIGRNFDKDNDGHLTRSERSRAKKALENGFVDKYLRGLDSVGNANKGYRIMQRRGITMGFDNTQDASALTYGPHHNAHIYPPHYTKTALELSRLAEAKAAGQVIGERYSDFCVPVTEPAPPDHRTEPRKCPISHIRERAEADHQAARVRGGLLPMNNQMNPERELKTVGLTYVEDPYIQTRGQLFQTRKGCVKREAEDLALKAEATAIPVAVQQGTKDALNFEFRRPDHVPMTLTRLKDQRKQNRIEYDMRNFERPPKEYPNFSANPEAPFWVLDNPAAYAKAAPSLPRSLSEPVLKVQDHPWDNHMRPNHIQESHNLAAAGKESQPGRAKLAPRSHVKRWTIDVLERGLGRNKPRLFDSIPPARISPNDLLPLDLSSSIEPVRRAAQERLRLTQQKNAGTPFMSQLWSDPNASGVTAATALPEADVSTVAERAPKQAKKVRTNRIISSEVSLRPAGTFEKSAATMEPRFFGSVAHISIPASKTAVRCGGFHRAVPGPSESQGQQASKAVKSAKGGETPVHS